MKKISILTLSIASLMLFSFIPQDGGIKKIDQNMWEIGPGAKMTKEDQVALQKIILKEYNLKDFKTNKQLAAKIVGGGKYSAIVNETIGPNWVNKNVAWRTVKDLRTNSIPELTKVLSKYN